MARRRGQRNGYVYRRGDSWFGQFRVDTTELDENGRFKRKTLTKFIAPAAGPGKVLKKRAKALFYEEHLKDLHKSGPLSTRTVAEFVAEVFNPQVVLRRKPTGKSHYEGMLKNHVLPALGDFPMRDVQPQHVYNLVQAKLDAGLSIQTVTHIRNVVSRIFTCAKVNRAYSGDKPTEGVELPELVAIEQTSLTWLQAQKIAALIGYPDPTLPRPKKAPKIDSEKARAKQAEDNVLYGALVRVLALTGLRIGEAMGLRWQHVDLDRGLLSAKENFVRGQRGTLKTKRSRRVVPLHSIAIAELRKLGPGAPDAPVFAGKKSGKPLDQHNIAERFFRPAAKRAGIVLPPKRCWHVLRHTLATLADEAGLTEGQRQAILGHSTPEMTRRYTHADLELVRGKLEQVGKVN